MERNEFLKGLIVTALALVIPPTSVVVPRIRKMFSFKVSNDLLKDAEAAPQVIEDIIVDRMQQHPGYRVSSLTFGYYSGDEETPPDFLLNQITCVVKLEEIKMGE